MPSDQNPADLGSRGVSASMTLRSNLWWFGPGWLADWKNLYPVQPHEIETDLECRKSVQQVSLIVKVPQVPFFDLSNYSSLFRATTVFALVLRFVDAIKTRSVLTTRNPRKVNLEKSPVGFIQSWERKRVIGFLVKFDQELHFTKELELLRAEKQMPKDNRLSSLYPFLDDGVIKVGGRLAFGEYLPESARYPIILTKNSKLTTLLIRQVHLRTLHAGPSVCLAELRRDFWIINCRNLLRKHILDCVTCRRFSARGVTPLMGDLPKERITPSNPFTHTGVDFGGPFMVKGERSHKAYMALFVCFATKACHLELVSSLTAVACTAALRRFAARRGAPSHLYSDNGTNFVGSRRELTTLQGILSVKFGPESMPSASSQLGTCWTMIPPKSPHWGGLWEAGIKSAKSHLKKIVGNRGNLEFQTIGFRLQ